MRLRHRLIHVARSRVTTCLLMVSIGGAASAHGQTTTFNPGTRELFVLDLRGLNKDELPKGLTAKGKEKPEVVTKDGTRMLKASERTELLVHLPENLQIPMPDSIALTLPLRPVPIDVSFDGGAFRLFTDGKQLIDLTNRQFVRGRILRVVLGGGCNEPGKCVTQEDIDKYSVYLSKLRIAAGGGVVANNNTQSTSQTSNQGTNSPSQNISKTIPVTVTAGRNGPVVSWPAIVGAIGYSVSRRKLDDANCCNNSSGARAVSPWADTQLPTFGTYVYRVAASTTSGQISGEAQFVFSATVTGVVADVAPTTGTVTPMTATPPSTVTKAPMADRSGPLNVATGPAPSNLSADGIPNLVQLLWDTVDGAVRYEVSFAPVGTTNWSRPASPQPGLLGRQMVWVGTPPDPRMMYAYRVIAYQADGKMGEAQTEYKTPTFEPKNFTATPVGPGQVRLEWDDIRAQWRSTVQMWGTLFGFHGDEMTYFLTGPGTGTGITVIGSAKSTSERNSYTLTGVPEGAQTWTVTVNWDPGGILTQNVYWPKASATVAGDPSQRYRLVALGFKVIQQSKDIDDAHDGHGDEVYFSAIVNRTKLTGDSLPVTRAPNLTMVMTRSHGDEAVSVPYGRIKAGTASATGGIKTGDAVPAGLDPGVPTGVLQKQSFPFLVWEGTLSDSDVVIVHPTLWEDDVNPVVHALWAKDVTVAAQSGYVIEPTVDDGTVGGGIFQWTADQIYRLSRAAPGLYSMSRNFAAWSPPLASPLFDCTMVAVNATRRPCEAHGVDRPLGLAVGPGGGFSARWHERIIFLTKGNVQATLTGPLARPEADWSRTTFSFKLVDNVDSQQDIETIANYELFFRIEKVP